MKALKPTSLSTTDNVSDCLDWKLETIQEYNKAPALVDYIGRGIGEIESLEEYISQQKREDNAALKKVRKHLKDVKKGVYEYLLANGMKDDLNGHLVSSIRLNDAKPSTTTTKTVFTLIVDEDEAEKALIALGLAEMKEVEVTKAAVDEGITVFKRKVVVSEVEE